ncbi:HNH endonuclease [Staphylococcus equorum]
MDWIIVCNSKIYDVETAFEENESIYWRMGGYNFEIGDILYIYVTGYLSSIKFKTEVVETKVTENTFNNEKYFYKENPYNGLYMKLKFDDSYNDDLLNYGYLLEHGLKTIQGPSKLTKELNDAIQQKIKIGLSDKPRQYFFVFQNKSYEKEKNGGYLWSPKHKENGSSTSHWSLMKKVRKGDIIIHSFMQKIVSISIATTNTYECKKSNSNVLSEGRKMRRWRFNADYITINNSINTKNHKETLYNIQPKENAPFNNRMRGNTGYLFKANKEMLDYILDETLKLTGNVELYEKIYLLRNVTSDRDEKINDELQIVDINCDENLGDQRDVEVNSHPIAKKEAVETVSGKKYPRDKEIAKNALKLANFRCEINEDHITFKRRNNNLPYTEPHHLIPINQYNKFENSLDVEHNIVSLCSNCHNKIHYGQGYKEKLEELFIQRKDKLENVGIYISLEELIKFYTREI